MPFIYYARGCAPYLDDYSTRLTSQLAVQGTEITDQQKSPGLVTMEVQHTDEQGSLALTPEDQNVKVTYTVKRYRREIERGLVGSLAGGALGSVLGGIGGLLQKNEGVGELLGGAIGGAVAGGAWEAYNGYDQSKHDQSAFAALLGEASKVVEGELMEAMPARTPAGEVAGGAPRDPEKEAAFRRDLDGVYGDILAVQEDLLLAAGEGVDIARPKVRADRAEGLYHEAIQALEAQDYTLTSAKIQAARSMVQNARSTLSG
jgi:hypothetical protein